VVCLADFATCSVTGNAAGMVSPIGLMVRLLAFAVGTVQEPVAAGTRPAVQRATCPGVGAAELIGFVANDLIYGQGLPHTSANTTSATGLRATGP
jgi:hypothetical protein